MLGRHNVVVQNAYIKYDFDIIRFITIIRGQSATGKTILVEMIRLHNEQDDTGIDVKCDKNLAVIYGRDWKRQIDSITDSIVFIDEHNRFVKSKEFAEAIRGTDNYYVIVTREKLSDLPYSVTEIYGIRIRGKYAGLVGEYTQNEFYRIFGETPTKAFNPDVIITEDSNSGYEFWKRAASACKCVSAEGKSNVVKKLSEMSQSGQKYLAVVDGAAFGAEMEEILQFIRYSDVDAEVYAPESFEYLILLSGLFNATDIKEKCRNTENYADSTRYMSWEQFYTSLLVETTLYSEMQYSKKKMNVYYLSDKNVGIIMKEIPDRLEI